MAERDMLDKRFWCPHCWAPDLHLQGTILLGKGVRAPRYRCFRCARFTGKRVDSYTHWAVLRTLYGWWCEGQTFSPPYTRIMQAIHTAIKNTPHYCDTRVAWRKMLRPVLAELDIKVEDTPRLKSVLGAKLEGSSSTHEQTT